MSARFVLRYYFDQGSGPLWSVNEAAITRYGAAVSPESAPLSLETREEIKRLSDWYAQSLSAGDPPVRQWKQAECDRFGESALALFALIESELGPDYSVTNEQRPLREDPRAR